MFWQREAGQVPEKESSVLYSMPGYGEWRWKCSLISFGCTYLSQNTDVAIRAVTTHSAQGLESLVWDKRAIQAKEEDGRVGQHASQDDQVVHVRTGHFD